MSQQENSCSNSSEWLGKVSSHFLGGHNEERPIISQPQCGRCHRAGTGQTTLKAIGSKWSYALKWCKPNIDDGDDMSKPIWQFLSASSAKHIGQYRSAIPLCQWPRPGAIVSICWTLRIMSTIFVCLQGSSAKYSLLVCSPPFLCNDRTVWDGVV